MTAQPQVTQYKIRDATGVALAVHERTDRPDGSKAFRWKLPDGSMGLGGTAVRDLPLYGIERVQNASTVVVTEGEKAAEALWSVHVPAIAWHGGASTVPSPRVLGDLAGKRVIAWPDNDLVGRQLMRRIAEAMPSNPVYMVANPESAPEGWDAADAIESGGRDLVHKLTGDAIKAGPLPVVKPSDQNPSPSVTKQSVRFRTARELTETMSEKVEWVAEPWAPVGSAVELAGKIKASGKTTFAPALAHAVTSGASFMGRPTRRGPVLYLTEQPDASFRIALGRAGLADCADFHFLSFHDCRGMSWPDIMAEAVRMAEAVGAVLIVVDTLAQFAGIRGDSENDAGSALAAMEPVQAATGAGLSVLLLRHERKGGGEVGESARGSSAFAGVVDIVLRLARPEGNHRPEVRRIDALSRFDETPTELMVELMPDGTYADRGTFSDMEHRQALEAIRKAITGPMTDKELGEATDLPRTSLRRAKEELLRTGELTRTGSGKKGDPYRVFVSDHKDFGFGHKASSSGPATPFLSDQTSTSSGHRPKLVSQAEATFGKLLA